MPNKKELNTKERKLLDKEELKFVGSSRKIGKEDIQAVQKSIAFDWAYI